MLVQKVLSSPITIVTKLESKLVLKEASSGAFFFSGFASFWIPSIFSQMTSLQINIIDMAATRDFAGQLAKLLKPGDVVLLEGDLGAGKSALARAIIQSLPDKNGQISQEEVPSPTFTIVQIYERLVSDIWHFDLYRVSDPEELYEIGIEEAFSDQISLIEWPDRLGHLTPVNFLKITIEFGAEEEARNLVLTGSRDWIGRLSSLGTQL